MEPIERIFFLMTILGVVGFVATVVYMTHN